MPAIYGTGRDVLQGVAGTQGSGMGDQFPSAREISTPPAINHIAPVPSSVSKSSYAPIAAIPTQQGPEGIRFDFNCGCRLQLPSRAKGIWRARLIDLDSGNTLFQSENQGATINSRKRWYVRFRIEVWDVENDAAAEPRLVFSHDFDLRNREAVIQLPTGTVGDTLGWFSYCDRFARRHPECRVTVALAERIIPLLRDAYPH